MLISLSNICVKVGLERRLLFHIPSFKVQPGEHLLISGASGFGKTTLLHLLSGLFVPDSGSVKIGEFEIHRMSEEERCTFRRNHAGIVFQRLNLIDHLTAYENVSLSLKPNSNSSKATQALEAVGLKDRESERVTVMSLGEQQRVAVARVIASEPDLIFADEPTSSLDEQNATRVIQLLIDSCKGKTLIVVSHDNRIEPFFSKKMDFSELIQK